MRLPLVLAALALCPVCACDPAPKAAPTPPMAPAAAPPVPARTGHMVCRDSQTGKKAVCGTPNAVMVGLIYDDPPGTRK